MHRENLTGEYQSLHQHLVHLEGQNENYKHWLTWAKGLIKYHSINTKYI